MSKRTCGGRGTNKNPDSSQHELESVGIQQLFSLLFNRANFAATTVASISVVHIMPPRASGVFVLFLGLANEKAYARTRRLISCSSSSSSSNSSSNWWCGDGVSFLALLRADIALSRSCVRKTTLQAPPPNPRAAPPPLYIAMLSGRMR